MSEFFNSEIVRNTMKELEEMQREIFSKVFDIPYLSNQEKKDYLTLIREFIEKQKLLFVRMSLSDDPEARETKDQILKSAHLMGLHHGNTMSEFFESLERPIQEIEKSLDIS